jgi:hypothetical protein
MSAAMNEPYRYSLSGRRPTTILGLIAASAISAYVWTLDVPWYMLAPVLIVIPMMLYAIIANPIYGMRIDQRAMEIDKNGDIHRILLSAIDYVKITSWTDSSDATVHLKDGSLYQIPHMTRPDDAKFREVLHERGITTTKG